MRLQHRNPRYLSEALIPASVAVTSDTDEAFEDTEIWIIATPSQAVRSATERIAHLAHEELLVVSVAKGIETRSLRTMSQVLRETLPAVPAERIGVLYGPSHAEEVAAGQPTAVVSAGHTREIARAIQEVFMTPWFRVYTNTDVMGVEIAGSVKNVIAIAAGISDGVGFGDNAKAALITRGLEEMKRLGVELGANPRTFTGLAGLGDLVGTCTSDHSRNRYVGEAIGKGRSLEEIEAEMDMVAEGVRTTESLHALGQSRNVDMPITEVAYGILFESKDPLDAVSELMLRRPKKEHSLSEQ
jgi:glycerol-3-phosphate dehydrogenase (NAD(P)+)